MAQTPDLYVVCSNCGNEVSPYITECPYCGKRLRKRAPKIERDGTVVEPRPRARKVPTPRLSRLRSNEIPGVRADVTGRPWATIALVALSLFGYLLLFAVDRVDVAVDGPLRSEWWRVAVSPFLYGNVWYELAAVTAIGVFGWLLERRHGPLVVLALFVVCGMGGVALDAVVASSPLAVGGNGAALGLLCAWAVPDLLTRGRGEEHEGDLLGAGVFAGVLLLMPLAAPEASAVAGFAGAAAGMLAGLLLARVRSA
jgi:membrane associated rhomboid family serine protease/DNA-directed RNA polymerase subunit RPC12/RpoP